MYPLIAILCFVALAEAKVSFKYSTIFDEYDLNSSPEIPLDSCKVGGCSVYVSVPQWNAEVTRNLFVYSKAAGTNTSLYGFATEKDAITSAKSGLHLSNTEYSIMNYHNGGVGPIVIYVVASQTPGFNSDQVEIYDASNINMRPAKNKKQTMIMSAEPFNIYVQAYGNNLNAFVRTTGFDNNYQRDSADNCRIIYEQNEGKPFRLRINSPVVTINFDGQFNYQICAKIDDNNGAALDYPGAATSQGYIGCTANSFQTYRSSFYKSTIFTLKDDHDTDRDTDLSYVVNTHDVDKAIITTYAQNGNNGRYEVMNDAMQSPNPVSLKASGYQVKVELVNGYGSSYWVGYKPITGGISIPSGQGVCTDFTETTTTPAGQTVPTQPSTTSGSNELFTALVSSALVFFVARNF